MMMMCRKSLHKKKDVDLDAAASFLLFKELFPSHPFPTSGRSFVAWSYLFLEVENHEGDDFVQVFSEREF